MSTNTLLESASIAIEQKSKNRSLISIWPLPTGFGHTLGNTLRRVLVSSLTGCAVVEAKIEGALHEYATLEGVQEDVLNILLNLRESAFSLTGNRNEVSLVLKANQIGPVTLEAIQLPHDVEIANPKHIIAHLTQARELHITLKVMRGKGEIMAKHQKTEDIQEDDTSTTVEDVNTLYLNATFNPVKRVSYRVERARVGEQTNLDNLILDLETNGTRSPESAIREAASIFLNQGLKVIFDLKTPHKEETTEQEVSSIAPILLSSIDVLSDLGARATKCLKAEGITRIGDLVTQTPGDLLLTPNLGKRSLEEIEKELKKKSLSLGMVLPDWPPNDSNYSSSEEPTEMVTMDE